MILTRFAHPLRVALLVASMPAAVRAQDTVPDRDGEIAPDRAERSAADLSPEPGPRLRFEIAAADASIASSIERQTRDGAARVETFFGRTFPRPVVVRVFPDRVSFDRHLREAWGMPEVACWMVGDAEEEALVLLSPKVWGESACDHDPDDADHVGDLVAHELVHVFHMQVNPSDEFAGVEGLDWFVEGLATFVSGQLERSHADRVVEAVEKGELPATLDDAWTGPYRYGVSGSLVAFVAGRVGRDGLIELLEATTREEVLAAVGLTEAELLSRWEAWLRRPASAHASEGGSR